MQNQLVYIIAQALYNCKVYQHKATFLRFRWNYVNVSA